MGWGFTEMGCWSKQASVGKTMGREQPGSKLWSLSGRQWEPLEAVEQKGDMVKA